MGEQAELFPAQFPGPYRAAREKAPQCPVVLVVEDAGNVVRFSVEGQPARRFGPGRGRKPRRALAALALIATGCTWPEYTFEDGRGGAAGASGSAGAAGGGGAP